MKKVGVSEAPEYAAPRHFGCTTLRLQGKDETGISKFTVAFSHILPGGGSDFYASPTEKVYFCVAGEITVTSDRDEVVLRPYDSVFIGADEGRGIKNNTNFPASMLVVINYPA
ncbi:MAG: cupin domain-containing protein [bacterium]